VNFFSRRFRTSCTITRHVYIYVTKVFKLI
jgi:hypothetical protein